MRRIGAGRGAGVARAPGPARDAGRRPVASHRHCQAGAAPDPREPQCRLGASQPQVTGSGTSSPSS